MIALVLATAMGLAQDGKATPPKFDNPEHGTAAYWKGLTFTPDTADPMGKRGTWKGWFHQDNIDLSKYAEGVIKAKVEGKWQDLKVVNLPQGFLDWNFSRRREQLAEIKKMLTGEGMGMGMARPEIAGPHNAIVASQGAKRKDSDFDLNNAVKGTGWLPRPEKLPDMIALLKSTWNDSMDKKVALLESLYTNETGIYDVTKQASLELYSQPSFETHTFLNQMVDPRVAVVFLDLPKSYELRCVVQMLHPDDPGLTEYERNVVDYINLVHDYFHGQAPRKSIGVIYHVVQVFDNSPGRMKGKRIVPELP